MYPSVFTSVVNEEFLGRIILYVPFLIVATNNFPAPVFVPCGLYINSANCGITVLFVPSITEPYTVTYPSSVLVLSSNVPITLNIFIPFLIFSGFKSGSPLIV